MRIIDRINNIDIYTYVIAFLVLLNISTNIYFNVISSNNPEIFKQAIVWLAVVPLFAGLLDVAIKQVIYKKPFAMPKTAFISGLFVAGILDPTTPLYILLVAAALAILSKHVIRLKNRNIFNPAGFGIAVTGLAFTYLLHVPVAGSWWVGATFLAVIFGSYISYRMKKLPLTLTFFALYPILVFFTLKLLPAQMLDMSFISGYFFFASFMLLEPRTSPYTLKAMVLAGVVVAILASVLPLFLPAMEFTLISLMAVNIFRDVLDKRLAD